MSLSTARARFSAYLRGIETGYNKARVIVPAKFSAYLRGIETNYRFVGLCCLRFRFQPTYEELKRSKGLDVYQGTLSFQPTYEELKLSLFFHVTKEDAGVFSLPTRN